MKEFLSNSWVVSIVSGIIVFFLTNAIMILLNKTKNRKQISDTTKTIFNRLKVYVVDNKSWHKKLHIWISSIAAICTILGISIFGDKSLFGNGETNTSLSSFDSNMQKTPDNNTEEEYHKGIITKTGWESKFIGLRYTNPEGMTMFTEEELDEVNRFESGTPSIIYTENELGYMSLTTVIEMMSKADDNSITVGVCVERLIDEADEVDISQFIEGFKSQMNWNPFYNYKLISDDETVKIGNNDYIMVSYMVNFNNAYRYQYSYFRVVGDRVIMIALNFDDEREKDNILNAFTAY